MFGPVEVNGVADALVISHSQAHLRLRRGCCKAHFHTAGYFPNLWLFYPSQRNPS